MKILIIGGVAGGATAAARLRRLDETAEIIILERGGYVSYANCGLPYYIGGVIENKRSLTLQTPKSFMERFRIEVRVRNEAISIDPKNKTVSVKRMDDGSVYTESYDKLILSPGAKAVRPELSGIDNKRIFTLRTVEDTLCIKEFINADKPKRAVVVGGGFIGLEMAENLVNLGIETTLLQRGGQVLPPLDYDMACEVRAYLQSMGLKIRLNESISGFSENNGVLFTELKDKPPVESDLVILAIGVVPETHLAKEAGLVLGAKESIAVNEHMQTSEPDIYAVGDAVEVRHFVTGSKALIALAGPANKQGRIAADNICGIPSKFSGSQGSSVIKLFDMTAASTGINEKTAKAEGIAYDKAVTYSASHATYYPGSTDLTIKTVFDAVSGKILGAQIVGFDGVDKRIDVLATAIHAGMTAAQLAELDLAYAPPYSSAKDPVNMAGFVIENARSGLMKQYHWHDIEKLQNDGEVTMLDTRTEEEYAEGHIEGTVNIPLNSLRERIDELDKTKRIYVNCYSGLRSYIACRILTGHGFNCYNLSGGYRFYELITKDKCYDAEPTHPCGIKIK
ncbi:MAG: FAD-dependent oxidoreductase [Oscillospiraceae bacterium]